MLPVGSALGAVVETHACTSVSGAVPKSDHRIADSERLCPARPPQYNTIGIGGHNTEFAGPHSFGEDASSRRRRSPAVSWYITVRDSGSVHAYGCNERDELRGPVAIEISGRCLLLVIPCDTIEHG